MRSSVPTWFLHSESHRGRAPVVEAVANRLDVIAVLVDQTQQLALAAGWQ
jgi:hypothetical protein